MPRLTCPSRPLTINLEGTLLSEELSALLTGLSGDDESALRASDHIAAHGEAGAAAIQPLLAHQDADVRWWAVRTLAEVQGADITPALISALADPDPAVRQCAALGLQQRPDDRAVPALIAALSDTDSLVVRLAANALAVTGAAAVPELINLVENSSSVSQMEAIRSLALIGDTRSIPTLFNALDSDSALMEYWANEGLERMGVGMVFFKP